MVDPRDDEVGGAFQFGAKGRDAGGHAAFANPQAIRLGELVVAVGSHRHPAHRAGDLVASGVPGRIQRAEKGAVARELAAVRQAFDWNRPDTVVGRATQDGVRDRSFATAMGDVVADGVAATRVAHQHDLARAGAGQHLVDLGAQVVAVLGCRRATRLFARVVVARGGQRHVDGVQPLARPAVGLEAPRRRQPHPGVVAVAVHEDDGGACVGVVGDRGGAAGGQQQRGRGQHEAPGQMGHGISRNAGSGRRDFSGLRRIRCQGIVCIRDVSIRHAMGWSGGADALAARVAALQPSTLSRDSR